jgi:hypothetical protein
MMWPRTDRRQRIAQQHPADGDPLPVGLDADRARQVTFFIKRTIRYYVDIMIFQGLHGVVMRPAVSHAHQVLLLLPSEDHSSRTPGASGISWLVLPVAALDDRDAVVELVGGQVSMREPAMVMAGGFESRGPQEGDQDAGLVLARPRSGPGDHGAGCGMYPRPPMDSPL